MIEKNSDVFLSDVRFYPRYIYSIFVSVNNHLAFPGIDLALLSQANHSICLMELLECGEHFWPAGMSQSPSLTATKDLSATSWQPILPISFFCKVAKYIINTNVQFAVQIDF